MATGDLSPDQTRYRDRVASATGLDPTVVTAWIGAESGWNVTKASHNYLNVGPGETFASVDLAATRAAALVNASGHYAGIRAAVPAGGMSQAQAIGASPWGTNAGVLLDVYKRLALGKLGLEAAAREPIAKLPQPGNVGETLAGLGESAVSGVAQAAGDVTGALVDKVVGPIVKELLPIGLGLVFTAGALVLIVLGLNRLTGTPARERFDQLSGLVGGAGMARAALAVV